MKGEGKMSHTVVLDLPEETLLRYQKGAEAARKPLEEFLVDRLKEAAPPYAAGVEVSSAESSQVSRSRERRTPESSVLSDTEAELLQDINAGFDEMEWNAYRELIAKRRAGTLQGDEQQELLRFIERREQANVRRIAALAELAQIRGTTLDALMDELGLHSPGYE